MIERLNQMKVKIVALEEMGSRRLFEEEVMLKLIQNLKLERLFEMRGKGIIQTRDIRIDMNLDIIGLKRKLILEVGTIKRIRTVIERNSIE